jgi:peptide/nickel transport system substrate-binding protein
VFEPHVLNWFFASDRIPGGGHEGSNRWRYRSAVVDELFRRGIATTDRHERRAIYVDVQRLLAADLPVLPLWHEDAVAITSDRAAGYDVPRDGRFGTLAN